MRLCLGAVGAAEERAAVGTIFRDNNAAGTSEAGETVRKCSDRMGFWGCPPSARCQRNISWDTEFRALYEVIETPCVRKGEDCKGFWPDHHST